MPDRSRPNHAETGVECSSFAGMQTNLQKEQLSEEQLYMTGYNHDVSVCKSSLAVHPEINRGAYRWRFHCVILDSC